MNGRPECIEMYAFSNETALVGWGLIVDSRKRIKTVVWTGIDRCVVDENGNVYF